MTRSGFSDPVALAEASRLSRRSALGFVMAMLLCNAGRSGGYNMEAAQAFALVFAYGFIGMALVTSGRLRMIAAPSPLTTAGSAIFTGMMLVGGFLLATSALTLVSLTWVVMSGATG